MMMMMMMTLVSESSTRSLLIPPFFSSCFLSFFFSFHFFKNICFSPCYCLLCCCLAYAFYSYVCITDTLFCFVFFILADMLEMYKFKSDVWVGQSYFPNSFPPLDLACFNHCIHFDHVICTGFCLDIGWNWQWLRKCLAALSEIRHIDLPKREDFVFQIIIFLKAGSQKPFLDWSFADPHWIIQ